MSTIDTATQRLIQAFQADSKFPLVAIKANDYDDQPVNEEVANILATEGLVIVVYVFGVNSSDSSLQTVVTCSVFENPQQRNKYFQSNPTANQDRSLQIVQAIFSFVRRNSKYQCGQKPLQQPKNACERILSESGRVQFDVRVLVPASTN